MVRNNVKVEVKRVGTMCLRSSHTLLYENTFYVSSFTRNLIFIIVLDIVNYAYEIKHSIIKIITKSKDIDQCCLSCELY